MPCDGNQSIDQLREQNKTLGQRLNIVTALLCDLCGKMNDAVLYLTNDPHWEKEEVEKLFPAELKAWWIEHSKKDAARRSRAQQEMANAAAIQNRSNHLKSVHDRLMSQLTDEELEALGFKRPAKDTTQPGKPQSAGHPVPKESPKPIPYMPPEFPPEVEQFGS